ncbi:MAG: energy-coupling factor transporter ATPase [Lachnospiraceae bacterium]|nr:energy-coupling factor transporter ATPase [Lachnospiraceae bacterium]
MSLIEVSNLTHIYTTKNEDGDIISQKKSLDALKFSVEEGEFVVILGANGSGKTTLARHLNALLMPTDGSVLIEGKSTADEANLYAIRSTVGMVFQNPDNQLVAQLLEDEVAFGPENLGLPTDEIRNRVDEALKSVGLSDRANFPVEYLSGGQKQLAAIAGVLAMQPKCMVLDEATSMLDPQGRREVLHAIEKLRGEKQIAIVMLTHDVEEALLADRICVMDRGRIVLSGKPEDIFQNENQIRELGLELPQAAGIAAELRFRGLPIRQGVMTEEELRRELSCLIGAQCTGIRMNRMTDTGVKVKKEEGTREKVKSPGIWKKDETTNNAGISGNAEELKKSGKEKKKNYIRNSHFSPDLKKRKDGEKLVELNHVTQRYFSGTDMQVVALRDVNFSIHAGEFIAIIGQTGSGKSTLLDLLGGLAKPAQGTVEASKMITGIVFQYPDHQLFDETVLEDVMFGPKNLGMNMEQAKMLARQALQVVQLPEETWGRSPLSLSGGEKRKAALAGVLAMEPEVLLLDEPTAGLAQADRTNLFTMLRDEYNAKGKTVLFTTHHMEDVAEFAERVIVLHEGAVAFDGRPKEVFRHADELGKIGLDVPLRVRLEEEFPVYMYNVDDTGVKSHDTTDCSTPSQREAFNHVLLQS